MVAENPQHQRLWNPVRGGVHWQGCDFVIVLECSTILEYSTELTDYIILPFSALEPDISEFSDVIKTLRNRDDKIRLLLSKAHWMEMQHLMGWGSCGCW